MRKMNKPFSDCKKGIETGGIKIELSFLAEEK